MSGWASSNLAMKASYQSPCPPGVPWIQSWSRIVIRWPAVAGLVAACGAAVGAAAAGAVVAPGAAGLVVAAGAAGAVVAAAGAGAAPPPQAARIAAPGILPSTRAAPRNIWRRESRLDSAMVMSLSPSRYANRAAAERYVRLS